ncbi:MAG: hypothetical protein RRX95_02865 [Oscillospiraceae bacterium]
MDKLKKEVAEFDINRMTMIIIGVLLVLIKLALSYSQYATIYPPLAPLDDDLMFRAAQSVAKGNWLGEYSYLTISKHMFFSLWLAFLHIIKIPYMVGNMALWALAALCFTVAFCPVLKRNWGKLFMFAGILYNPAISAQFSTRIYRDSIFPALCVFFFAGVIAVGLRYKQPLKKLCGWLAMYGAAFGLIFLCREDGVWVLPFWAVAFLVLSFIVLKEKSSRRVGKIVGLIAPFIISGAIIASYCFMNYEYYGRFIVSDFTSAEFKSAYGALTSLKQDNWQPIVAVPEDVRADVYREVPMFSPVEKELKNPHLENSFMHKTLCDYSSGSFYWALRTALNNLGVYDSPQTAQIYLENLTAEIQKAVDEGRLVTENGKNKLRKSVTPPIKIQYVPSVFKEGIKSFLTVMSFEQCDPVAEMAVGSAEEIEPVEEFIRQKGARARKENTTQLYFGPIRKVTHGFLKAMVWVYRICIPIMFVITIFWQIKQVNVDLCDKKFTVESMLNIILAGLVGMSLLRCAMIAFVEVSSFGIGTYAMYLSTVHPLLIAYCFVGFNKTFEN